MLNSVFQSKSSIPAADTINEAGGKAYSLPAKAALAQYAVTGVFNDTFYVKATDQLDKVKELCGQVSPEFIAKLAVYSRTVAQMKDVPAYLLAYLAATNIEQFSRVFGRVVTDGDMLKRFVQIIRSGVVGRKSLGTRPRNEVRKWLNGRNLDALIFDSVGNDPSLADVIKLSHVKANSAERQEMFKYLCGNEVRKELLPQNVQDLIAYHKGLSKKIPNVPFQMLTALNLGAAEWTEIARNASFKMTVKNLNTFQRHGVFKDNDMVNLVAARLSNVDQVRGSRMFPYQLLTAYKATSVDYNMPRPIVNALQDGMEYAIENVPEIEGQIDVFCDVSQSMQHSVTGTREGTTSAARCIDVASLVSAAILRKNNNTRITPFNGVAVDIYLNPRDSVMTNAEKLSRIGGGSTYCPAPLKRLIERNLKSDVIVYVSDNESWINGTGGFGDRRRKSTELAEAWRVFRKANPNARMVCVDVTPGGTTQALDDKSILNIGGWSDSCFNVISKFVNGNEAKFVDEIEQVQI